MSESILFALRLLAALLLLAFMGVILLALLRDGRPAALAPAQPMRLVPSANPSAPSYELRSPTWVGHNPNCAIFLDDDSISSRHARIEWKVLEQTWWVEDNLSRNGTWVNGVRVSQSKILEGDEITFGSATFKAQSAT